MILRRIQNSRFSVVHREWEGATVVLLGGGPSLSWEQVYAVQDARYADAVRVVAINDAYLLAPWADVCYAADSKWHTWQAVGVAKPKLGLSAAQVNARWVSFSGQKCSIQAPEAYPHADEPYQRPDVHLLRVAHLPAGRGLSTDPEALATGRHDGYTGHGGFQALNLATLAGAKTVLLLGFDGRPGADGRTHFHGEHPVPTPADVWDHIRRSFSCVENEIKAAGVCVLNCSPGSAIDSFAKLPLAEALQVAA